MAASRSLSGDPSSQPSVRGDPSAVSSADQCSFAVLGKQWHEDTVLLLHERVLSWHEMFVWV